MGLVVTKKHWACNLNRTGIEFQWLQVVVLYLTMLNLCFTGNYFTLKITEKKLLFARRVAHQYGVGVINACNIVIHMIVICIICLMCLALVKKCD